MQGGLRGVRDCAQAALGLRVTSQISVPDLFDVYFGPWGLLGAGWPV